jgi:hypothetical protein
MRHRDAQTLMYEYERGELTPPQAKALEDHVAHCDRCFAELQILRETVRLVPPAAKKPSDERSEDFWARFVEQVDQKTHSEQRQSITTLPFWDEIWAGLLLRRPQLIAAAGALAVIALVLVVTMPLVERAPEEPMGLVGGVQSDSLRIELANYFRTSKILFVGISNMPLERGEYVDFTAERQVARKLVRQARMLDNRVDDERSRQLIKAMERILIELANMEQRADVPDIEIVRSGMHQENMLFKIRMAETEFSALDNKRIR